MRKQKTYKKEIIALEPQLAASMLYYDIEEFKKFKLLWNQIEDRPEMAPSGNFYKFVNHVSNYLDADENPSRDRMLQYIKQYNQCDHNAKSRNNFAIWIDQVESFDNPATFELADELFYHYCWLCYKDNLDTIDNMDISFKDKLSYEPIQISTAEAENIFSNISDDSEFISKSYSTGLDYLDRYIKPSKTHFVVIAARPGVGKSTFMLQQALHNAQKGIKCLFISMEMTHRQLEKRIINWYKGRDVDPKEYKAIKEEEGFKKIDSNLKLIINKTSNGEQLLKLMKESKKLHGTEIMFLDYLQLIWYNNSDEWGSIRKATKDLKRFGASENVLVVTCSQVSRDSENYGMSLASLFGGSSIEADTDIVIGIEVKEKGAMSNTEDQIGSIKILKNRDGASGVTLPINIVYTTSSFNYGG